jgi:nucleotide sugar dehydrogenase
MDGTMNERLTMAIVGHGFVGKAVDYGFPDANCIKTIIDPKYGTSVSALNGKNIDVSFVCVPTPMNSDAKIDVNILVSVVQDLLNYTTGLIVIKSTVTPDILLKFEKNENVIYNPEFLTEKAANEDFVNPFMHVFGGSRDKTELLEQIYLNYSQCKSCPVYHMTAIEASFVKYAMNGFLASKVLWFNQLYDIIEKFGGNYNVIRNAIGTDPRIGHSHTIVPGPSDNLKGFSGSCFPKDTAAFVMFARDQGVPFTVLEEVVRRNQDYRTSYGELLPREKEMNVRFDYDI